MGLRTGSAPGVPAVRRRDLQADRCARGSYVAQGAEAATPSWRRRTTSYLINRASDGRPIGQRRSLFTIRRLRRRDAAQSVLDEIKVAIGPSRRQAVECHRQKETHERNYLLIERRPSLQLIDALLVSILSYECFVLSARQQSNQDVGRFVRPRVRPMKCEQTAFAPHDLETHVAAVHLLWIRFECPLCPNVKFPSRKNGVDHFALKHPSATIQVVFLAACVCSLCRSYSHLRLQLTDDIDFVKEKELISSLCRAFRQRNGETAQPCELEVIGRAIWQQK
uniref:Uncharacterized protein n=1 Tax=Plectus sambesii TaxID=2011161 RepID=A0A914USE4_9BILA